MTTKVVNSLGAAIGCRLLPGRQQLAFVEYAKGAVSTLDLVRPADAIVSHGTTVLKGTWIFDCETGGLGGDLSGPGDIWWEQLDAVHRQMVPVGGASIVNLGQVDYAALTPAVLQNLPYARAPIPGNKDATNQLVNGDVFAVRTAAGNVAKIRVAQYDYNMTIEWATYRLAAPYHCVGSGYATPEDIAVCADERTAYVTERTGSLLKIDLQNANRAAAKVIAAGMQAPQQIALDEAHRQAYVVEYASPGRLLRIDLVTGQQVTLLSGLNYAVGLLISSDLAHAYISEQGGAGRVSRYALHGGERVELAAGLTNPFFLTWANAEQSAFFVAERDPANRITLVETQPRPGSVRPVAATVGARPSSVACLDATHLLVCCDNEIDSADLLEGVTLTGGIFKGIGLVPENLITPNGFADTSKDKSYPYQFPPNSPFGGTLSLQFNHALARQSGVTHYRVLVDNVPFITSWSDLKLNPATGKYDTSVTFKPMELPGLPGCYEVRPAGVWFYNTDLGMLLNSAALTSGPHILTIQLFRWDKIATPPLKAVGNPIVKPLYVDNQRCTASIDMPTVGGVGAPLACGMLPYKNAAQRLTTHFVAAHPARMATFTWSLGRAGQGPVPGVAACHATGQASLTPFTFDEAVGPLLGPCASAAYYAHVYVASMAINGYARQSQYDASCTIAFALTLQP
jgi:hypothetical protein